MSIRRTGRLLAAPLAAGIAGHAAAGEVTLTVTLPPGDLAQDAVITADVAITLEGLSALGGNAPTTLLQLDVPPSVRIEGRVIDDPRQLQRNEFVEEPWERQFDPTGGEVRFRLTGEPAADERLGISVLLFLEDEDGARTFVRRRVDLPLTGGASVTTSAAATDSGWGRNGTLEIGQRATAHDLPRADGTTLKLEEMLGQRPIVITTYRAFW